MVLALFQRIVARLMEVEIYLKKFYVITLVGWWGTVVLYVSDAS
jgi:hypothetical protein